MSELWLIPIRSEMLYYHIRVKRTRGRPPIVYGFDLSKKSLEALLEETKKEGEMYLYPSFEGIKEKDIEDIDVVFTSKKSSHFGIGRLKGKSIFEKGKIVTSQFIKKPSSRGAEKKKIFPTAKPMQKILSKNIFIVHGRDHKPLKELKVMLKGFGLNPIVLHEKASGSRTIVEKLEKYSEVGYTFVILTPDDIAISRTLTPDVTFLQGHPDIYEQAIQVDEWGTKVELYWDKGYMNKYPSSVFRTRSRQNVVLEFGYFIGLLGRDRVCCLYKGDVELPSDMHGIVYIPFKNAVNEVQGKITKELKEVGYKIKR